MDLQGYLRRVKIKNLSVTIRPAQPEDAEILAKAESEIARFPGLLVQTPGEIPPAAYAEKVSALKQRGRYIVAQSRGRIVGHAFLEPMGLFATRHVAQLTIVVHPGFQGRGVGAALLSDLLAWAKKNSALGKIELLVRATNERAISLYRKFGFAIEGRFRNRVKLNASDYVDDIAMAWFPDRG